ncbi:MAG: hypothetical protein JO323_06905 [Acidobacteriia bacterium]|nr:hypothetical protein [Terriglobia bacterium]
MLVAFLSAALAAGPIAAQSEPQTDSASEDGSAAGHARSGMNMVDMTPPGMLLMNLASGTSENAAAWPMPMITAHFGAWNAMFMGQGFLIDTQQSGPRGADKFYSSNWLMGSLEHRAGVHGAFEAELMLSLEPATVTGERYPLLFQTGETAYGKPIVDGQHPHNLIMSLGFHYAYQLGEDTIVDAYFAPVGDPALGPVAFPHRASALELPQAPISHHWQDATHISDEVVTVGISHKKVRVEASGFYGSEPGENRWVIQTGPINSWAARVWFFPTKHWAAQVSAGRIAHPEVFEAGDQVRTTASLQYIKARTGGSWASTFAWGRNHNTATFRNLNSYLVETVLPVTRRNFLTGRAELVDKDELFDDQFDGQPDGGYRPGVRYGSTFRIGAYTAGYTRDLALFRSVETGIGANLSIYSVPEAIRPYYGNRPMGANMFIRLRLRPSE